MPGPFDPEDAYWSEMRKSPAFVPAWNAALWEASKLIRQFPIKREVYESLQDLALPTKEDN